MKKLLAVLIVILSLGTVSAFAQMSLAAPNPTDAKLLAKTEKDYATSKANFLRHASPKSKQAYIIATVRFGTTSMVAATLPPRVKYRQALRLYREALKLDPGNHEAKTNSDLIVSIYKSMNRPVPN